MQTIHVKTWEEFEDQLKVHNMSIGAGFLFRGQSNSCRSLDTTLERCGQAQMRFLDYYRLISVIRPQIETFTGIRWDDVPPYQEVEKDATDYLSFDRRLCRGLPAYRYMTYLRHHGFPSPLLDWTRTPYVAAYFAFRNVAKETVAIYVYSEMPEQIKSGSNNEPDIHVWGPYVQTHRRHFIQQSAYTTCLAYNDSGWRFSSHEGVFALNNPRQDVLWKFTIPSTERLKVLKLLDAYNLNAFSLFESEESLMETMALRELDFKR
jgi:hypothetical protein